MAESYSGQAFTGQLDSATRAILPSALVTHVHLLRHGDVAQMGARVVRGQLDVPLSPHGQAQSEQLATWMQAHVPRPDAIWTSDLSRCVQLAELCSRAQGLTYRCDSRLREQSMGRWEGRTWEDVSAQEPAATSAYWDDYWLAAPSGGESLQAVQARALEVLHELLAQHAGGRVVIVTHIGIIRTLLCAWLGVPGTQALRFAPATASHTQVLISDTGAVLEAVGERPWLYGAAAQSKAESVQSAGHTRARRIALSGSAGTGKTTLGKRLAAELGVPYIEEVMRTRLERGLRLDGLSRADWRALIRDLWREQSELQAQASNGFVADRSSIDYAAFWLHYGLHTDAQETAQFFEEMSAASSLVERIVVFPWGVLPLVADGVRTPDPWTQLAFHNTLQGMLRRYARSPVLELAPTRDLEERMRWTLERL